MHTRARVRWAPPSTPFLPPGARGQFQGRADLNAEKIRESGKKPTAAEKNPKKIESLIYKFSVTRFQKKSGPADRRNGRQTPGPLGSPCERAKKAPMGAKNRAKMTPRRGSFRG